MLRKVSVLRNRLRDRLSTTRAARPVVAAGRTTVRFARMS
jgi:hypothetical protein